MEFGIGLAAAKTAIEIGNWLIKVDKDWSLAEMKAKAAELLVSLSEVRITLSEANTTIADLQSEVSRLRSWGDEREQYELAAVGNGVLVYRYRGTDPSLPDHSLCPTCFNRGTKSILQPEQRDVGRTKHLVCNACSADLVTVGTVSLAQRKAR